MKPAYVLPILLQACTTLVTAMTSVKTVSLEHYAETFGIGESSPRISWKLETEKPNWQQKGYEIEITWGDNFTKKTSSGFVETAQSVLVAWPGRPLNPQEIVNVSVRVTDTKGERTGWSPSLTVEAGMLDMDDWVGVSLVEGSQEVLPESIPPAQFRRLFKNDKTVVKARLHITAHGLYEAYLNGKLIGDHVLAPGWTAYDHELQFQSYDVTELLHLGQNVLGVYVAEGWYSGRLSNAGDRHFWGNKLGVISQLIITYNDNSTQRIVTDSNWRYKTGGPVTRSEIYDGEDFDARIDLDKWLSVDNATAKDWSAVTLRPLNAKLRAPDGPPIRRIEHITPVSVTKSGHDTHIVDFGQNLVGWLKVTTKGPVGHQISFTHAEALEHGIFTTRPLRTAKQLDQLTLSDSLVTWEPRFTFHGFRYVEVKNWPGLEADLRTNLTAVVIHTDMRRTGTFVSSNELINKLHENVRWSMRGNFVGIPTDCPQRDERLGWTGDIQAFAPTASFLYDCSALLTSYLRNLALEQTPDGIPPVVSPNALPGLHPATAIWGDAIIHVPYAVYQATGDVDILSEQLSSMLLWLDEGVARSARDMLWNLDSFQFGDWLDPNAPPEDAGKAMTDRILVADSFLIASTDILIEIAHTLNRADLVSLYAAQVNWLRQAFARRYTLGLRPDIDTQTAYTLAIHFELLMSGSQVEAATDRLIELVSQAKHRIATGFAGTPIIGHALTRVNQTHLFYKMLLEQACPSWLYPVTMNATTVWERWDSMLPNGDINTGTMTSFNHYALGSVAHWMHSVIGGLKIIDAGWRRFEVKPIPGGDLIWAKTSFESPYGMIKCEWEILEGRVLATIVVPPNTQAEIALPGQIPRLVGSGIHTLEAAVVEDKHIEADHDSFGNDHVQHILRNEV